MRQQIEFIKNLFRSKSGQGMVEYILILVVSTTLLLLLMAKVFTPMQEFLQSYMGKYVECLLETGELPTLGGENRIADDGCNTRFDAATIGGGRPPRESNRAGANGDTTGGRGRGRSSDDSGGSGGGTYAGSAGRQAGYLNGTKQRTSVDGVGNQNPKIVEISLGTTEEAGFQKNNGSSAFSNRFGSRYNAVITYGVSQEEKKKLETQARSQGRIIAGDLVTMKSKKMTLKPPEKAKEKETQDAPWSFGDYIRYILIAAIIIVLGLLIGGQALRLSKES